MSSLVELSRRHHAVWIDPDQVLWSEAVRGGAKIHFIDGQDLTVDNGPGDVDILLRRLRQQSSLSRRQAPPATSLAMALLAPLGACREQLKEAAEQLRELRDDKHAWRIARETIDFLTHSIKSFQVTAGRPL
jgi:hypothetical protein